MDLLDELELALGVEEGDGTRPGQPLMVEGLVRRVTAGEGAIAPPQRIGLLFDVADWLWAHGRHDAAIGATTAALGLARGPHALDAIALARRLDVLAVRLEADGHDTMAAEVWKRAIELTERSESDRGQALAWRLERYLKVLERIGAPKTQIDAVRDRIFDLPIHEPSVRSKVAPPAAPAPASAPPAPSQSMPMPRAPAPKPGVPTPESMQAPPQVQAPRPHIPADLELERGGMPKRAPASTVQVEENLAYHKVPVHFATHRKKDDTGNPYEFFGNDAAQGGAMSYGIVHVTVPKHKQLGALPVQGWVASMLSDPDPALYMTIRAVDLADRETCLGSIAAHVEGSRRREAFVFVHGFNNSFADAARRCAQLAVDLDIDGVAVLYSWPSKGSVFGFVADRDRVRNRRYQEDFRQFLIDVVRRSGATHVHVVAHSMGCQLALSSLATISETELGSLRRERVEREKRRATDRSPGAMAEIEADKRIFSELVFAAPDVDREQFRPDIERVMAYARRTTVYTSTVDMPLKLASFLSSGPRAGLDASALADIKGLACIDTTKAPDDWLAHGSFASRAIDDMQGIIWLSLDPAMRRRLIRHVTPAGTYWEYDPEAQIGLFARALALVRKFGFNQAMQQPEVAQELALKAEIEKLKGADA